MKLHILILVIFSAVLITNGQYIPNSKAGKTPEMLDTETRVGEIIEHSGRLFKEGLLDLQDNRRLQARDKFDKAIEVFLIAGVNVRSNAKLQGCYAQLIETVYRMEFPTAQQPAQIKALTATCGWNIDTQLSDSVAKIIIRLTSDISSKDKSLISSDTRLTTNVSDSSGGFSEQKFEPSPLDELAKLELSAKEENNLPENRTVKAIAGDTISKLAFRTGVSATEMAKLNGLFPDSVLPEGKEIKIPNQYVDKPNKTLNKAIIRGSAGLKPLQNSNGTIPLIIKYLNDTLNDPYSVRFVKWSNLEKTTFGDQEYWLVVLKLRAKNVYNAYILGEIAFYIRNNQVINVIRLN